MAPIVLVFVAGAAAYVAVKFFGGKSQAGAAEIAIDSITLEKLYPKGYKYKPDIAVGLIRMFATFGLETGEQSSGGYVVRNQPTNIPYNNAYWGLKSLHDYGLAIWIQNTIHKSGAERFEFAALPPGEYPGNWTAMALLILPLEPWPDL